MQIRELSAPQIEQLMVGSPIEGKASNVSVQLKIRVWYRPSHVPQLYPRNLARLRLIITSPWPLKSSHRSIGLITTTEILYRYLLGAHPDQVSGSRTGGRRRIRPAEFVPGKFKKSSLIGALPVWERTALNVKGNDFTCLRH